MGYHILGDWGTSSARFYLYEDDKHIDTSSAPGIKYTRNSEQSYIEATASWIKQYGPLNAVLCGMVGANIGWKEAGYCLCPATLSDIVSGLITFSTQSGNITIVPGVKTKKGLTGMPDVMRGEETQVLGFATLQREEGLLCLPGTHTKWVHLKEEGIENFVSSMNGELFNILLEHSILIGSGLLPDSEPADPFRDGVDAGASGVSLNQLLFSVRAHQLNGTYTKAQAKSYLLGLLIGSDVHSAFALTGATHVNVIAGSGPARFYTDAIGRLGGTATIHDGQVTSLNGLQVIYNATRF